MYVPEKKLREFSEVLIILPGAPDDRCIEPLESISDWILSCPDVDWNLQLRNASLSRFVPQYHL